MIRVAIVEDDAETRNMLAEMLRTDVQYEVIGTFGSAEEFLEHSVDWEPEVVILDIHLPGMSGIDCLREAAIKLMRSQFLMFTVFEDDDNVFEALRAGAQGYLLKKTPPSGVFDAIRVIHAGGSPMSPVIARKVINSFQKAGKRDQVPLIPELTPRENEILQALAKGLRYKEISDQLYISMDTVRTHIRRIYEKLQVNSRTEAVNKSRGKFPENRDPFSL